MSPQERKYAEWLHELIMEQSSGSPYWRSPEPLLRPDGPTYVELREMAQAHANYHDHATLSEGTLNAIQACAEAYAASHTAALNKSGDDCWRQFKEAVEKIAELERQLAEARERIINALVVINNFIAERKAEGKGSSCLEAVKRVLGESQS
jgi:hypothetical protein